MGIREVAENVKRHDFLSLELNRLGIKIKKTSLTGLFYVS